MRKILLAIVAVLCINIAAYSQATYYVDASRSDNSGSGSSWATAKKDLQVAINMAAVGDQVWVKAGTYLPTHDPFASTTPANNRDKTFSLKNGVKIYGGFAGTETQLSQRNWQTNITTLSGDLGVVNTLTDNAYHVLISVNITGALLDGVTITKGYATAPGGSFLTIGGHRIDRYKGGGVYNINSSTSFTNCSIKANSADCTNTDDDAWGAGIVNDNCTSSFTNCMIDGNSFLVGGSSFGVFGAGMIINAGSCTITGCTFVNNTSGSGFLDASRGGALYISSGSSFITNCVFYNNSAQNGAVLGCGGSGGNQSAFTNCTFAFNTSSFAGTTFSGFAKAVFRNCILWNNTPTSTSVPGRNEIYSQEANTSLQPSFINCIVRDATGTPPSVVNVILTNCLNGNPLFTNGADGDGADNIFMTADDGLRLQCGSPAIGTGTGSTPATDILNLPRVGVLDMGAYEGGHSSATFNAIPAVNTIVQLVQNAAGVTSYSDCSSKLLEVQSGGTYTVNGTVTARVWIESSQPVNFVKRHYEIAPQQNAAAATGRVTLYFTQQEFNDFNAVNATKLPTGPADAAGIARIQVEKRGGTSNNGTGLPPSYTGPIQTILNAALTKTWNATAARWEISFDVNGFGGFFLKTQVSTLPLQLLSFTGNGGTRCNTFQWQTENEINTREFAIEKSADGVAFSSIGVKAAAGSGNNLYTYNDCSVAPGKQFYRLKMLDNDGRFSYSPVIKIENNQSLLLSISPNPAKDVLVISSGDASLLNTRVRIMSADGKLMMQPFISQLPYSFNIKTLPPGVYFLQFSNGKSLKMLH